MLIYEWPVVTNIVFGVCLPDNIRGVWYDDELIEITFLYNMLLDLTVLMQGLSLENV